MHEEVWWEGAGGAGESGGVEAAGVAEVLLAELVAGEPELGAPGGGHGGDALEGGAGGGFAGCLFCFLRLIFGDLAGGAFAFKRGVPAEGVVHVGFERERAGEGGVGAGPVVALGVDLGEVDEDGGVFGGEGGKDLFGFVHAAEAHEDDGPEYGAAGAVGVGGVEVLGGFGDLGEEAVVERIQDEAVELVGIGPSFVEHVGEDFGGPLLAGDLDLAAVFIEGADGGGGLGLGGGLVLILV